MSGQAVHQPPRPSLKPRGLDATTSAMKLINRSQCPLDPPLPDLNLNWLPIRTSNAGTVPFLLLHESHVGEVWLTQMLRAAGVSVLVPKDRGRVRETARNWFDQLAQTARGRANATGRDPWLNATSREPSRFAVGLALTPSALRILNHGVSLPAQSLRTPQISSLRVITLSRSADGTTSGLWSQPQPSLCPRPLLWLACGLPHKPLHTTPVGKGVTSATHYHPHPPPYIHRTRACADETASSTPSRECVHACRIRMTSLSLLRRRRFTLSSR